MALKRRAKGGARRPRRGGLAETRTPFAAPRRASRPPIRDPYEQDFYSWTRRQAAVLRRLTADGNGTADFANLAEEIESLGKEQASALRSSYQVLLAHLLKWQYQPVKRSTSWRNTIRRERRNIELRLEDNPGLKNRRAGLFARAYRLARADAADETDLPVATFPIESPWSLAEAIDEAFWPG